MEKFTAFQYIKIDIANKFGMDKKNWDTRLDWTEANIGNLENLMPKADEPLLYIKAVNALRDAQNGVPTGFIMGLDATGSGLQLMACLIGCHQTAINVNLINTGKREDIYDKVARVMSIATGSPIFREYVKHPVMTTFYGSMNQPKEAFGEGTKELHEFYQALQTLLPGAVEVMNDIQSCWDPLALKHQWPLPDGHIASVKVMQAVDKKIEVDELDHATFTHRAYINMPNDSGLSLAANVIHSIDGYVVRQMYRLAKHQGFDLLTIHDSFWSSPNFMQNVRENYANILADIANSNLLQDILQAITGSKGTLTKYSDSLGYQIKMSNYSLS